MERERERGSRQPREPWSHISCGFMGNFTWPPRSYPCSFCRREFRSAQALGGHMNVHRRDRARLRHGSPPPPLPHRAAVTPPPVLPNLNYPPPANDLGNLKLSAASATAVSLELGVGLVMSSLGTTTAPEDGLDLELRLGVSS